MLGNGISEPSTVWLSTRCVFGIRSEGSAGYLGGMDVFFLCLDWCTQLFCCVFRWSSKEAKQQWETQKPLRVVGIVEGYFQRFTHLSGRTARLKSNTCWVPFQNQLVFLPVFFETNIRTFLYPSFIWEHIIVLFSIRTFSSQSPKHKNQTQKTTQPPKNSGQALCVLVQSSGSWGDRVFPGLMGRKGKMFWMAFGDTIPILSVKNQGGAGP